MGEAVAEAPLDKTLANFMSMTAKSTVAVVIPLYGYWSDVKDNPVNGEVLQTVLHRIYSNVHQLVLIFVAHPQSIEHVENDPDSVGNILLSKVQAGNVLNVAVKRDASYAEYVEEGMYAALNETKASFIVVFNPWVLIQDGSLDVLIDRANYGDNAKVISGFNMREPLKDDIEQFERYKNSMPTEQLDISLDFLGMPRFAAEMLLLDPEYRTNKILARDIWQQMSNKGFDVITTQRIPIFPFDFPWSSYETPEDYKHDTEHFKLKYGFDPGINYGGE